MVQEPSGPLNRAFHSNRQVGRERFLATMPWQPTITQMANLASPDVAVPRHRPVQADYPKFQPHNGHHRN